MSTPLRPKARTSWESATLGHRPSTMFSWAALADCVARPQTVLHDTSRCQHFVLTYVHMHVLLTCCHDVMSARRRSVCDHQAARRSANDLVRGSARARRTSVAPVLTFDIDRSSPTPLYFQLAQAIEGAISGGALPSGSKLENEVLLAQRYGLSRPTVRRAVQELVDKGLLVRKRGVGTQVIQPHVRRSVELTSLYDDLARAGEAPTTEVLSLERVPASAEIAEELDLVRGPRSSSSAGCGGHTASPWR